MGVSKQVNGGLVCL